MTKGKGYLLPAGDASEEELACCIVFYPARDEYRRALMGSLDYLATWIAWERDSEKRGQDAAASWKLANIQTWECCSMGFCNDLITSLDDILAAITALECCGTQDITDGDQYTDPVVDGVGDVPQNIIDAGYADDAADWDGFDDYKCMISHLAVDHVETFFREIAPHISDAGWVVGGVGVVGALLGAILVVVGLPIAAGLFVALGAAAGIWTWISSEGRQAVEDLADEIAENHDALACAIYEGDGVADSVSDFNDKVDELFSAVGAVGIKAINISPQLKAMYGGRYDQQDIAQNMADQGYELTGYDCACLDEDPPPSGYHLEYPVLELFRDFRWCSDSGSSYNENTGILQARCIPLSTENPVFDMTARFEFFAYYGYVIDVISYTNPTLTQERGHNLNAGVRFENDVFPGDSYVGIHTARINRFEGGWQDWLDQYDFEKNMSGGGDEDDVILGHQTVPGEVELYTWTLRIRALVQDT